MSFGDYLQGSIELIVVAGAMAYAAVGLRGRLLPGWSGASARLAEVVLGLSLLVVTLELVGVVGLYRPGWVLLGAIVVGVGIGLALRPPRGGLELPVPAVTPIALAVPVAAALLVAAHWAMPTQTGLDIGMYLPNTTWHNAPFAARFVQEHRELLKRFVQQAVFRRIEVRGGHPMDLPVVKQIDGAPVGQVRNGDVRDTARSRCPRVASMIVWKSRSTL